MIWVPVILVIAIGLLSCVPRFLEQRRSLPDTSQSDPGRYAQLSQGRTHFEWHGPARGKVIVAIHGLTTPSVIWDKVIPSLTAMGYRVLSYDLYGRGSSDAPTGRQNRHFFLQQLQALLAHEGIDEDITLMGYSMGGAIAVAFAQEQPHRVAQVILVAPSGIISHESGFSRMCRKLPYVGDWFHGTFGARRIKHSILGSGHSADQSAVSAVQLRQLDQKGYLPAILSSRRGLLSETQQDAHVALAKIGIPVSAIWGDKDQAIPITALGMLATWNRHARHEVIKGADHDLPYTHSEKLTAAIRDLLKTL